MTSTPVRLAAPIDPAERSQHLAVQGRDYALAAIEGELSALRAAAQRCAAISELHLAPPGLRDLFQRQARAAALTIGAGSELVRRAREDGLL